VVKPKNWRQIQAIRWRMYNEFKEIIEDFFMNEMVGLNATNQKERLLDLLKKATEMYHA